MTDTTIENYVEPTPITLVEMEAAEPSVTAATGHHPGLYATGRHGCWARCSCGWESQLFTTISGAHLAFGQHLAEVSS
jgi:hypothetical protein